MSPSKRRKRADSHRATFGLAHGLGRQMTAPINPPAFGNYHVLGEPAWDGWNPGTNSGGGPSKLSLNDQGNDGQVNWLQSDPLPGPVDHIAGCIPNMPAYNVPLSALDEVILPEVNPNRGGIQGLHPAGNYSHQLGQLLSRVEVPGNGLPISGSEGTGQPVRATKVRYIKLQAEPTSCEQQSS